MYIQNSFNKATVPGQPILDLIEGMGPFKETASQIFWKHGIRNPQDGQRYPLDALLDSLDEIDATLDLALGLLRERKQVNPQSKANQPNSYPFRPTV